MAVGKYKYYFKKPKSEITKDVFKWLMITGAVAIAATSPYFITNLLTARKKFNKYPKQKISSTFYKFRKQGLISIKKENHQIYISLTTEGKKKAGWLQIDSLKITKPKKWDKKWRMIMFDIAQTKKLSREALRGKLKEIGFCPFQKSIWIHPFDCEAEIELLKNFFNLSDKELRLIIVEHIGDDREWRGIFKLT
ncbi:MAG: hypothetical protein HYT20_00980 [Candidatus Nealsonbacteria bacterium]|nr:hypothetical protein [Candidatus Nealsonbacteria bacterium]